MNGETECLIEDVPWRGLMCELKVTIYFHQTEYHRPTRWQCEFGGEVSITGLCVDSAQLYDRDGNESEAGPCERYAIGLAVMDDVDAIEHLIRECEQSV